MAEMKRAVKDSVFSYLFRQPQYTLELYKTLHPEDEAATEEDLTLVTIENVLSNGLYNDVNQGLNKSIARAAAMRPKR